ncbi:MAG: alpha/beta fold hydrolase, partial [Chitinophagaceae bacterium]|nr:alpha/beta fold hydrolase [Chitinophagaceae bacterium]
MTNRFEIKVMPAGHPTQHWWWLWLVGLAMVLAVPTCKVAAQANCMQPAGFTFRQALLPSGTTLSYVDSGRGDALILIHGLGGNAGHWQMNIGPLAAAGYRVIALNLPGYGGTLAPAGITGATSLKAYAAALSELVAHLGLKKAALMGHSMGGQVAILLALQKPNWLHALLLAAPAGLEVFTAAEGGMLRQFATPAYFEQQDSAAIRQSFLRNFYQLPPTAEKLVA